VVTCPQEPNSAEQESREDSNSTSNSESSSEEAIESELNTDQPGLCEESEANDKVNALVLDQQTSLQKVPAFSYSITSAPDQEDPVVGQNAVATAQLIIENEDQEEPVVGQNTVATAQLIIENEDQEEPVVGQNAVATAQLIIENEEKEATVVGQNAVATAQLIIENEDQEATVVGQNPVSTTQLIIAHEDQGKPIVNHNAVAAGQLISANEEHVELTLEEELQLSGHYQARPSGVSHTWQNIQDRQPGTVTEIFSIYTMIFEISYLLWRGVDIWRCLVFTHSAGPRKKRDSLSLLNLECNGINRLYR
jgi:hypothetical protein